MKNHDKETKEPTVSSGTINPWMVATVILAVALVALVIFFGISSKPLTNGPTLSPAECGQKMVGYINNNLVQSGTQASLATVSDQRGVYEIITNYQGRNITVYATHDCSLLFIEYADTSIVTPTITPTQIVPVKSKVPQVDLYVMAFCPYGVQAENSMKPVVDLLGKKANISLQFIVSIGGDNITSVQSLHGINEAKEDARQSCIMKNYPDKFWSYLIGVNEKCYPQYTNNTALDACWKGIGTSLGIDTGKIESCAYGSEGISMLRTDEALTAQNGVTGSPTIIINGQRYNGQRTAEAFKQAICDSFEERPPECAQQLSTNTTVSGQC